MAKARKAAAKTKRRAKKKSKTKPTARHASKRKSAAKKTKARKSAAKKPARKRRAKKGIVDTLSSGVQVVADSFEESAKMQAKLGSRMGIGEG